MNEQEKEQLKKLLSEISSLGVVSALTHDKLSNKLVELTSLLKEHIK